MITNSGEISLHTDRQEIALSADQRAAASLFMDHALETTGSTLKNQLGALNRFAVYLHGQGIKTTGHKLQTLPSEWTGITWGLLQGLKLDMVKSGYAIGTINTTIYSIRTYVKLAWQSGIISDEQHALYKSVNGYSLSGGIAVDQKRRSAGAAERVGSKKSQPTVISPEQEAALVSFPAGGNEVDLRNQLIMVLLLEHGLRRSELTLLNEQNFDRSSGVMTFIRPKVHHKKAKHQMTDLTLATLNAYWSNGHVSKGEAILRKSWRAEKLIGRGLTVNRINDIVKKRGLSVGMGLSLSPHDCRHHLSNKMEAKGYTMNELMEWFDWTSHGTALRYQKAAETAERYKG